MLGRTRVAVIGYPAEHSLSPAIHSAGYRLHGLDWLYSAVTLRPEELEGFVTARLRDSTWAGLSVTAPHKEAIVGYGQGNEDVLLLGAANTLILGESPSLANTDVTGFVRAWRSRGFGRVRTLTIVGAGATARSVLLAASRLGVDEVTVAVRNPSRAADLIALADVLGIAHQVVALDERLPSVELLVSTIPAAATVECAEAWAESAKCVFDVVYDQWPTPLSAAASARAIPALNGLDLLAGQAVDQFRLMTGLDVTFEFCRSAAERELRRRLQV